MLGKGDLSWRIHSMVHSNDGGFLIADFDDYSFFS